MCNRRLLITMCMMWSLTACRPSKEEPPAEPPKPLAETVFAPAASAMDKARSVEGALQQGKDNANSAIEAAD
jgi:hypothetical protein